MRKKILFVVSLIVLLVCVFTSCANDDNTGTPNTPENPTHTHAFEDWKIIEEATCTMEGAKERYCACGERQTATVPTLNHNYESGVCSVCGAGQTGDPVKTAEAKFDEACALITSGKINEAYTLLNEISDYAPAKEKLNNFFFAPTSITCGYYTYTNGSWGDKVWHYRPIEVTYNAMGNIDSIFCSDEETTYKFYYDSKGNELAGYDLDDPAFIYDSDYHTCTYKDGKLHTVTYPDSGYGGSNVYEYFYNEDGSIDKYIYSTTNTDGETYSREYDYTYTYYNDGSIKTMRYIGYYEGYECQYDENGILKGIDVYDESFTEVYGSFNIIYGSHGVEKYQVGGSEIIYDYDSLGRIAEFKSVYDGELVRSYVYSDYQLCYSENPSAKESVIRITKASFEYAQ